MDGFIKISLNNGVISIRNSSESKYYLKLTFYMHLLLYIIVLLKLSEDILDRLDIFILELQELRIPKPDWWEWLYGASFMVNLVASRAMQKNAYTTMRTYHVLVWLTCILPLAVAQYQYLFDFILFVQERDTANLTYVWRELPLSVVFEAFSLIAIQVHFVQIYFSYKLFTLWQAYSVKKSK